MNKNREIVVVEDNPDDELMILDAFEENHVTNPIVVLRDGEEALDYFFARGRYSGRELHGSPLAILLDLNMPKVNGIEVLRELRAHERTKTFVVIILTTSTEQEDLVQSYELGANSFVRKPVDFDEFNKKIKSLGYYWELVNIAPD